MVWGTVLVPAMLFMVRRPEDVGLLPDGRSPGPEGGSGDALLEAQCGASTRETEAPPVLVEESWTRGEALRTRTFWLLTFTLGIGHLATQAINLHLIPYVEDLGHSASLGALAISARSAMQLVGSPFWGVMAERIDPRYLACIKFLLYAVGIYMLMQATSVVAIFAAVLVYGMAQSGTNVVTEVMWANYYGRFSLGAVRGLGMPFMIGFSATGPLLAGAVYDATQSYNGAFLFIIGGAVASSILILFCTRPRRRPMATPSPDALA
jgi:MFS family permease